MTLWTKSFLWASVQYLILVAAAYFLSGFFPTPGHAGVLWFPLPSLYHNPFFHPFIRWDAFWYDQIALHGYISQPLSTAFWPLYPWLLKLVLLLHLSIVLGNVLIPFFATVTLIYVGALWAEGQGVRGFTFIKFLMVFPTSFFFFASYPTSLFLLFVLLYFWSWERWKPIVGFVAGILSALTWNTGLFLFMGLFFTKKLYQKKLSFMFLLAPLLGLLSYMGYLAYRFSDPLKFMWAVKAGWGRTFAFPWVSYFLTLHNALQHAPYSVWVDLLTTSIALLFGVLLLLRGGLSWPYILWTWLSLLIPMSSVIPSSLSWLMSMPRFILPAFPIFWLMAKYEEDHPILMNTIAFGFAITQIILFTMFAQWYWVA